MRRAGSPWTSLRRISRRSVTVQMYYAGPGAVADSGLGASMESLFVDDLRFADEIRLDVFRRRPRTQRLIERAASVLASLL